MVKELVRRVVHGLGFEFTRRQPDPPTPYEVQKMMMGTTADLVIFDVGAHHGSRSKIYRRLFSDAVIYGFEPTPAAVDQLRLAFAGDDLYHPYALALSDRQGEIEFHLNAHGSTNSLLGTDAEAPVDWRSLVKTEGTVTVATQTIDTFCAENDISKIDMMKIDVQGAESRVLRGAREMLARGAIKSVYLEIIVAPTYVGQSRPDEIFTLLCGAGLSLVDFYDIWKCGPVLLQFDALFALPEYVNRIVKLA